MSAEHGRGVFVRSRYGTTEIEKASKLGLRRDLGISRCVADPRPHRTFRRACGHAAVIARPSRSPERKPRTNPRRSRSRRLCDLGKRGFCLSLDLGGDIGKSDLLRNPFSLCVAGSSLHGSRKVTDHRGTFGYCRGCHNGASGCGGTVSPCYGGPRNAGALRFRKPV